MKKTAQYPIGGLLLLIVILFPCRIVVAQNIDYDILCGLQQRRTCTIDKVMQWTSNSLVLAPAIPSGLLVAGYAFDESRIFQIGTATGLSFLTAATVTEGVKLIVRRPRPYKGYPDDLIPVRTTYGYSFPSGHTSLSWSIATSLSLCCPKWYVIAPSILWASGVAFSRLYLGVHYPSDVIAGMLVGVASGFFGYWLSQRIHEESDLPNPKIMTPPVVVKF